MKTVLECLEGGASYLRERGIESPRRNMEWLLAQQLSCSRIELYASFDRPMNEQELAPLRGLLKRRGEGEPLQHILGTVEFAGREFLCDKRALIPRPETEEMVESALKLELKDHLQILDVGTGSGVIGITIALSLGERCASTVLTDISPDALALARENADRHALPVSCIESDLLEGVAGKYHLILANLPYVSQAEKDALAREVAHDPATALFGGNDGLDILRRFIPAVKDHLSPSGWLVLEIGSTQGPEVVALAQSAGLNAVRLEDDLSGKPRFVFAQAP